ncbi:hypothetical protein OF83DRAFT_1088842 [Amylostereum chailletii]|nr:hypothetical protein OF83DRAFT_1088842 [Amylostereum chailletii]
MHQLIAFLPSSRFFSPASPPLLLLLLFSTGDASLVHIPRSSSLAGLHNELTLPSHVSTTRARTFHQMPDPFPYPYDYTYEWMPTTTLLVAHTGFIPIPPRLLPPLRTVEPQPFDHTAPYLTFICQRVNGTLDTPLTDLPAKSMWTQNPNKRGEWVIADDARLRYRSVLDDTRRRLDETRIGFVLRAQTDKSLAQVMPPDLAMERATDAYSILVTGVTSWNDFLHAYRALQRSLKELAAFFDCRVRGAIVSERDLHIYRTFGSRHIPVYAEVSSSAWTLDPSKRAKNVHNHTQSENSLNKPNRPCDLPQWFYPPAVAPYYQFERQARGTLPRSDPYVPSTRTKQKKQEGEREQADLARLKKKYPMFDGFKAGNLPYWNEELRHLVDASPRPSYIPAPMACYTCAFNNVDMNLWVKEPSSPAYYFPPVHILWGPRSEDKRLQFFYRLVTLWPHLLRRLILVHTDPAVVPITSSEWRAILGDQYFKYECWPQEYKADFNPDEFYWYGGSKIFGTEMSNALIAAESPESPSCPLDCGCVWIPPASLLFMSQSWIAPVSHGARSWMPLSVWCGTTGDVGYADGS